MRSFPQTVCRLRTQTTRGQCVGRCDWQLHLRMWAPGARAGMDLRQNRPQGAARHAAERCRLAVSARRPLSIHAMQSRTHLAASDEGDDAVPVGRLGQRGTQQRQAAHAWDATSATKLCHKQQLGRITQATKTDGPWPTAHTAPVGDPIADPGAGGVQGNEPCSRPSRCTCPVALDSLLAQRSCSGETPCHPHLLPVDRTRGQLAQATIQVLDVLLRIQ